MSKLTHQEVYTHPLSDLTFELFRLDNLSDLELFTSENLTIRLDREYARLGNVSRGR